MKNRMHEPKEKLVLRTLNKIYKQCIANSIIGPYRNKVDFLIGVEGVFLDKEFFQSAWNLYQTVTYSRSQLPAILYKEENYNETIEKINSIYGDADLEKTWRLYSPVKHIWPLNVVWIMAFIHSGLSFVFNSDLSSSKIENTDNYRTYAREVTIIIAKGQYQIRLMKDNILGLIPNENPSKKKQLNYHSFEITNTEIENSIRFFNQEVNRIQAAKAQEMIGKLTRAKL